MKELEDPESTRVFRIVLGRELEVRVRVRDSGLERVDVLSVAWFTQGSPVQSLGCVKSQGLLSLFLAPCNKASVCSKALVRVRVPVRFWLP